MPTINEIIGGSSKPAGGTVNDIMQGQQPQEEPSTLSRLMEYMRTHTITGGPVAPQGNVDWRTIPSAGRNILEALPKMGAALDAWEREHIPGYKSAMEWLSSGDPTGLAEGYTDQPLTNEQIETGPGSLGWGMSQLGVSPETQKSVTQHQPQNPSEQLAMGAMEFAPNLVGGGAPLATKLLTRIAGPMAAMEGVGSAAGAISPALETPARFVTAVLTGGRRTGPTRELADAVSTLGSTEGGVAALSRMLRESGMGDAEIRAKLADLGLDANLMDVNPAALQAGGQIYAKGGTGRNILHEELTARDVGTQARTQTDLRQSLGPEVNETAQLEALQQRLRDLGQEQRQTHTAQMQPADLTSIVDDIDVRLGTEKSPEVRRALEQVRANLHVRKTAPNQPDVTEVASEPILSARQAIDEVLYDAKTGQLKEGLGRKTVQALTDLRAKINEQLDTANPTLRAKDVEIEQAAKDQQAYETGRSEVITTGRKTLSPEEFAGVWNNMASSERAQVQAGLTRTIDQMVGLKANDRVALKQAIVGEGKWNHQKIATIIGEENAANLVRTLQREATFQDTLNRVTRNSETAGRQSDIGLGEHPGTGAMRKGMALTAAGGLLAGPWAALVGAPLAVVDRALSAGGEGLMAGRRAELAKLLASGHTDQILKAIELLRQTGLKPPSPSAASAASQQEERR